MNVNATVGGKRTFKTFSELQHPPPTSGTPADVLKSFGLALSKAQSCAGLKKYLHGQAPAPEDVPGMLRYLETELPDNDKVQNAAALMVAIQKSHQAFVPRLEYYLGMSNFETEFFQHATTAAGLKVCTHWSSNFENELVTLLVHPKCSICTLDFSWLTTAALARRWTDATALWKNSSVKTWQGCPVNFKGLQVIGLHVRELRLRLDPFSEADVQNLQTILQQGNIHSVGLDARSSAEHLPIVQAVRHANSHGGRVHEVHLWDRFYSPNHTLPFSFDALPLMLESLEILCKSRNIISVTLPDSRWLSLVDLAVLKDWLKKGSVESLSARPILVEADAHEKRMEELRPVLTNNRQRAAMPMGIAFGSLFCHGATIDAFGTTFGGYLTRRAWYAVMIVNKRVYIKAMQIAHERWVPYAPASNSPGAGIDKLIQKAIVRPFSQLALWLAEGLRQHAVKPGDLDALDAALRTECAAAIDAAFNDVETARRNELQTTSQAEAQRIAQTLFQPDSFATPRDLREHLALALAGPVPAQGREEFKKRLLFEMKAEFARMFEAIVD